MYDTDEFTEFILKFGGISNPFTLADDDVLLIPNEAQAVGMMADNSGEEDGMDTASGTMAQIRNFFKFVNTEYQSDKTSYEALKAMKIPSGVIDTTARQGMLPPYISEDGRTAVTIRGSRVYFGEDTGMNIAGDQTGNVQTTAAGGTGTVTKSVQSILNSAITSLSDSNCLYNGMTLADFFRGNVVNKK